MDETSESDDEADDEELKCWLEGLVAADIMMSCG